MGLVLDSGVVISAEREKRLVSGLLLASLSAEYSETELLLSSISVMELEHGWHRANTPESAAKRRRHLDEVLAILPVEAFTREMGVLAAKIDADTRKVGLVIATAAWHPRHGRGPDPKTVSPNQTATTKQIRSKWAFSYPRSSAFIRGPNSSLPGPY